MPTVGTDTVHKSSLSGGGDQRDYGCQLFSPMAKASWGESPNLFAATSQVYPIAKTCGKCPSPDGDADGGQSWGGGIYFEAVAAQPPGEEPSGCCPDSEGGTCTPEGLCGPGLLNTSNGNVIFSLRYPSASPFEPDARLIYNSRSTESANYGFGWTSRLHRWVEEVTFQDADLHEGDGTVYSYTNHNVSTGYYTPPDGATSALKRDFTGKWTEERADGFVLVYDSAGDLNTIQNPAGGVWTNNYTGTPPKLHSVVDPSGRRTTYSYDGGGMISKITDAAGRETLFEVNGNDDVVKHVTPELCTTSLTYDGSHRLIAYQDPEGHIHSYGYDSGRLASYTNPLGHTTTVAFDGLTTTVINALGHRTTLTFNSVGHLLCEENALGNRTTHTWEDARLRATENALGFVTTYAYDATSHAGKRLQSITNALGHVWTYEYDSNNMPQAAIDPLGSRTTAVWNGSEKDSRH